jgi:hypothetical protein
VGDVAAVEEDGAADRIDEPLIAFSSVDLPAPFVPSRATISPGLEGLEVRRRTGTLTWSYATSTPRQMRRLPPFARLLSRAEARGRRRPSERRCAMSWWT